MLQLFSFNRGKIEPETEAVYFKVKEKVVYAGKIENGSFLLEPKQVEVTHVGDFNCVNVIKTKMVENPNPEVISKEMRLGLRIFPSIAHQRVLIRPKKFLYFNRVAKTGSQAMARLLYELGRELQYYANAKTAKDMEKLCDSDNLDGLFEEMDSVLKFPMPMAIVKVKIAQILS